MRMVLSSRNIKISEKKLTKLLCTNKNRGAYTENLIKFIKKLNLIFKEKKNSSIKQIRLLNKQKYLIILLYYIEKDRTDHYAILKNIKKDRIYLLDPYFGKNKSYSTNEFIKIWHSDHRFEKKDKWLLAINV